MRTFTFIVCLLFAGCDQLQTTDPPTISTSYLSVGDGYYETLSAGQIDNWSPSDCSRTVAICQVFGDASGSTISGINSTSFARGDLIWIKNLGTTPILILHNSNSSSAENRMHLPDSQNLILRPKASLLLYLSQEWAEDPSYVFGWRYLESNAMYGVVSTTTPSRTLGTAFRPSTSRPTMVTYSASVDCDISLSGGEEGRIEFLSDSSNPPTTVRADVAGCKSTGTVVLGVAQIIGGRGSVSYMVPAGDYVLLQTVTVTGTPTPTLTRQTEQGL